MPKHKIKHWMPKLRKVAQRQRPAAEGRPPGPARRARPASPPPRWDRPDEDDPDGGAGVREPWHPCPTTPVAAMELEEPKSLYLDLTR